MNTPEMTKQYSRGKRSGFESSMIYKHRGSDFQDSPSKIVFEKHRLKIETVFNRCFLCKYVKRYETIERTKKRDVQKKSEKDFIGLRTLLSVQYPFYPYPVRVPVSSRLVH